MNTKNLKNLLEACFVAKKVTEQMPPLPTGIKTRHIHVIGAIEELSAAGNPCRVSDVSKELHITLPSITKLISELESLSILIKVGSPDDKRTTFLELTDIGKSYAKKYVSDYHKEWSENLNTISTEQINTTIYVIEQLYKSMPKGDYTNE